MTPSRKSFLVALAITLPVLACSPPPKQASAGSDAPAASAPAASAPAAAAGSSDVVATIGSESITMADLEKAVKAQLIEVDNQRYEILEEGLGNLVSEKVLGLEAKAKGKTVEEYQQELMSASTPEPSDADVQKVYDENKEALGGKSLDEVKGRIVEYLKGQARSQKIQALLADLRTKYKASIKLAPPAVEVSDGGRASRGGGASAPITIVAFSDYECPYCKRAEPVVAEVLAAYGNKIRYVHRDYPLPFHKFARKAAEAARCAGEQGKFWEAHDALFQAQLSDDTIASTIKGLGIDQAKYDACLKSDKTKAMIDEDQAAGQEAGVSGTPAFFINGRMLSGAQPAERFKAIIDAELSRAGK